MILLRSENQLAQGRADPSKTVQTNSVSPISLFAPRTIGHGYTIDYYASTGCHLHMFRNNGRDTANLAPNVAARHTVYAAVRVHGR